MATRKQRTPAGLSLVKPLPLDERILTIRGQRVILDTDLAELYGVTTKALNQAVKRNVARFPNDFAFVLAKEEKAQVVTDCDHLLRLKFSPTLPHAFTEHGAIMAATVLNSARAVHMSVFVVRAFVRIRAALSDTRQLARKLAALERELTSRLDTHEAAIVDVLQRIMGVLDPPPPPPEPPPAEIGFHVREEPLPYRIKRRVRRP